MTSFWLQAQLKPVINVLTLKTVDISSRFSPVFHHIYQWVKFKIIILDDRSDIQPFWRACNQRDVINKRTYSHSFPYQTSWNISETNHKNKKLENKLHYSLKSSFI
jgi:hypothetical protein